MKTTFVLVFLSFINATLSVRCWVTAPNNQTTYVAYNARVPTVSFRVQDSHADQDPVRTGLLIRIQCQIEPHIVE